MPGYLHVGRYSAWLVLSLLAYFVPPASPSPTVSQLLVPFLASTVETNEHSMSVLKLATVFASTASLQPSLRSKVDRYYSDVHATVSKEKKLPAVQDLTKKLQLEVDFVKNEEAGSKATRIEGAQRMADRQFVHSHLAALQARLQPPPAKIAGLPS